MPPVWSLCEVRYRWSLWILEHVTLVSQGTSAGHVTYLRAHVTHVTMSEEHVTSSENIPFSGRWHTFWAWLLFDDCVS